MEQSFADAANNHHFKRSRWRRLWRQQIQMNVVKVASFPVGYGNAGVAGKRPGGPTIHHAKPLQRLRL
jgi:hypothetical protein